MRNIYINLSANAPQNTGGGNSHSSIVVTPVWKGSRPTISRRSTDSQSQDHRNHTPISKALKYAAMLLMILTLGVGNAWGADECTTLVSFATSQHQTSSPRKVYGYTSTEMTEASRVELACNNSNTKGQNSGAEIRLDYGQYLEIPSQTSVTSVTVDYKFYNSGNTQRTCSLKVAVGSTERQVLISGKNDDGYQPAEFTFSPAVTGTIKITNMGSGNSNMNLYLDNISYCTSSGGGGGDTPSTYTVTYDGNGKTSGDVPTDSNSPYEKDAKVTVLGNTGSLAKTNYTFTGWNTEANGSGTHYDAGDKFDMGTTNVTLYAQWEYNFTTHSPGIYKSTEEGGYGRTLKTVDGRDYEVYLLISESSDKGSLYAGPDASTTDGYALYKNVSKGTMMTATDGWLILLTSGYAGSGNVNTNEFAKMSGGSNLSTHYAAIQNTHYVKFKISGYDQFSFIGRDNHASNDGKQFVVKIDGEAQTYTHNGTDNSIFRFDISTGTHIIEITGNGANDNRFRGFSLRLPCTLTYDSNGGTGTMANTTGSGTTTLRTNTYTKAGCTFQGWATSQANANAGTVAYADGATNYNLSADATLYAVWKLDAPTITCEDNIVTMTVPGSATVYYTTDGSTTPTSGSTPYDPSNKPEIAATTTYKAIAILTNHVSSDVATQECIYVAPTPPSTKRIYLKCGSTWCDASPKFFAHSWGSVDNDVEMTQMTGCETDTYYGDIPADNTGMLFTRQNSTTSEIIWSGDDFWGKSENITIGENNLFTCTGWSDGLATFSAGTYAAPTYTISFAGNGNTDGSMSNISSLACGANQALTANAFTKAGYSFANWIADVAVTIGGETVNAGSAIANQATIQNISSDIALTAQWTQEIPTVVEISGAWKYFPGQTISLTANTTGGTSDFTYQWQKYVTSAWEDIEGETAATYSKANCTISDCGSYRCVVSKLGASIQSEGYDVHIYTLNGNYDGSDWISNDLTVVSGTVGKVELSLEAGRLYEFKVKDNFYNYWFGNANYMLKSTESALTCAKDGNDIRVFTGAEGTYTFTVDINHAGDNYVEVSVAYPSVTHPVAGFVYYDKGSNDWDNVAAHWWKNEGPVDFVAWANDPWMTQTTTICGTTYYYMPKIEGYDRVIFHNAEAAGQTSDITVDASSSGKYIYGNSTEWQEFPVYTVIFNSNGGSAVAEQEVPCGGTASEPTAPTRLNYDFEGWQLNGVDYNFATVVSEDITLDAVWTRKAVAGIETDITLVSTSAAIGSTSPLTDVYYGNNGEYSGSAAISTGGAMFGTPMPAKKWVGFTIPASYTATVETTCKKDNSNARHCVLVTETERAGAAGDAIFLFDINVNTDDLTATSASIEPGAYCVGSTSGGLTINSVIVHLTYLPTVKLKVLGSVTQTISITVGEKLGEIFASGSLPTPVLPDGYTFKGWKNETGDAAVNNNTVTTGSMVIYADIDAPASTDATLSALTVNGDAATVDPLDATQYTFTLPFGTTAVPTVVATPTDAKAVATVTANTLSGATIEVVPESGEGDKVTYTITYSIVASKDIQLVFKTGTTPCVGSASTASQILSNNAAVSTYINQIAFTNVEGSGDNGAEGTSLNVGKKAGNMFTLSAKPGFAMKSMNFLAKIQDATCEYSLNGGEWTTLTSTNTGGDECYAVFSNAEIHEFRLRSTGAEGVWIRNMQLTMIQACTSKTIAWTTEPAAEYELGSSPADIAASANNGTVSYASTDGDVIAVNESTGALTLKTLGSVTLSASVPAGDGMIYCDESAQVSKANVKTYYLVTFDAQNETTPTPIKYYSGDDAIALPEEPTYSGFDFLGWFDASTGGNAVTSAITPTASRTVYAQWEAKCAGPTITVQPASADYKTGRTAVALACTATAGDEGELTYTWYSCDDAERTNPVSLAGAPTPSTAAAGTFYYYCTVQEAGCDVIRTSDVAVVTVTDKDPVCIIKATPTSGTEATADGAYIGNAYFKGRNSDKKLNSPYDYVGVELASGYTFLTADKVVLNQVADLGTDDIKKFFVYAEEPASEKTCVTITNASPVKGDNWFDMPAGMAGESALYIGRKDANCNPTVGYLAVYRVMMPELQAISINGRAGELDALAENTFNVTIPFEADLASLTVVPTIARNAAHATTPQAVITNDGAWVLGNNTYRVMDKDGDYTDYNIVLTRDVLKYTVSYNMHGGTPAIDDELVVAGGKIAAAPADPTREDYIFQGWSLTDGGDIIDIANVTIDEDKVFHAVWVSDGGIKLLDGSTVNTTNFITGVTATTVSISGDDYDCVAFGGTVNNVNASNMKNLNSHVTYNATTTQTKIRLSLYNSNGSKRTIYVKGVVEGTDNIVDLAAIELNGNEKKTTEYIEFNNAKNRSIYIFVSSNAGDIKILQVKVMEEGAALKKAGEIGYSLNMNKGRMFGASGATINFEGLSYTLNGDYTPLSSEVLKMKSASITFTTTVPVQLSVETKTTDKTYYITRGSAGTDNPNTRSTKLNLAEPGTWYITAGGSEVQFTGVSFDYPQVEITENATDAAIIAGADVKVKDGKELTLDDAHTIHDLIVEEGGKVTLNNTLTVENLYLEAQAGASGQLLGATNVTAGAVYMDINFFEGAETLDETTAGRWYMISAPFDVNLADGFYKTDGTPMVFGQTDGENIFDLFEYDGSKRATTGVTGWKRVQGKMNAGRACLIGFNPGQPTTIRLKAASTVLSEPTSITLNEYAGDADNQNWNGVANPTLHYTNLSCDVQTYNNEDGEDGRKYIAYSSSSTSFVVGTAFFVQATGSIDLTAASHSEFRAPQRQANERYEACVRIFRQEATDFADQMYVRASENASNEYEQGHDMITWNGTTANTALIWANNYGKRLAIEEAPMVNDKATYNLGIFVPAAGTYRIEVANPSEDATLYLTKNGRIFWNLTMGACELDLAQGQNNEYGLVLRAEAPQVTTGMDEIHSEAGVQKLIIDENVFILRGEQLFDMTGKAVK